MAGALNDLLENRAQLEPDHGSLLSTGILGWIWQPNVPRFLFYVDIYHGQ